MKVETINAQWVGKQRSARKTRRTWARVIGIPALASIIGLSPLVPTSVAHASVSVCPSGTSGVPCAEAIANNLIAELVDPTAVQAVEGTANSLITAVVDVTNQCLNDTTSTCQNLERAATAYVLSAITFAKNCAARTDPTCDTVVQLAEQLAHEAVTLAAECIGGQNATCSTAEALAEELVTAAETFATTCVGGTNATCTGLEQQAAQILAYGLAVANSTVVYAESVAVGAAPSPDQLLATAQQLENQLVNLAQDTINNLPTIQQIPAVVSGILSTATGLVGTISGLPGSFPATIQSEVNQLEGAAGTQVYYEASYATALATNGADPQADVLDIIGSKPLPGGDSTSSPYTVMEKQRWGHVGDLTNLRLGAPARFGYNKMCTTHNICDLRSIRYADNSPYWFVDSGSTYFSVVYADEVVCTGGSCNVEREIKLKALLDTRLVDSNGSMGFFNLYCITDGMTAGDSTACPSWVDKALTAGYYSGGTYRYYSS